MVVKINGSAFDTERVMRFVLLKDIYGNTFPQCFAPLSGELEYLQE